VEGLEGEGGEGEGRARAVPRPLPGGGLSAPFRLSLFFLLRCATVKAPVCDTFNANRNFVMYQSVITRPFRAGCGLRDRGGGGDGGEGGGWGGG
jgi:hypothetical protein